MTYPHSSETRAHWGAVLLASIVSCSAMAVDVQVRNADPLRAPFVTVNGEPQPNAHAELLLREQLAQGAAPTPALRTAIKERLVEQALMAQAAHKDGLDKLPLVQARVDLVRQELLAKAWQEKLLQGKQFSDDEIKAEYKRQTEALGPKEYRIRHLFVASEDTAKLLIDKIARTGTKLSELAAEYSRDEHTRQNGGLSEWTPQGQLTPELLAAVKPLRKGSLVPTPVRTQAGWHVLQLEDERNYTAPEQDKVKPQLLQALARQFLLKELKALRASARVE